ncbi:MAG: ABC transporter ATP-binding protein [Deltaproteobacteria bacterium]|jgi:lipoprotein-releasing system ATP-binding protein|nr:ABC transporter ATP-binding protein [Deltaproteobacteria bacterium]
MALQAIQVSKSFGEPPTKVLHELDFLIEEGEFVALTGRSGSGKSTLLYLLGALDFPTSGKILIDNKDISEISSEALHELRNRSVGFVFQFHYLLPELTAIENVLMPSRKAATKGVAIEEFVERAHGLMDEFGLSDKKDRLPRQLSGGEQQRVAIARALAMRPRYLFADEPTGSLDTVNGDIVMSLFEKTNREDKTTVILVTHDPGFAARATRQIKLVDGKMA